jgi:hypothetical protein
MDGIAEILGLDNSQKQNWLNKITNINAI